MLMLQEKGEPLTTTAVAKILGVSKPAVHQMGHELIDRDLITREDYGEMHLTERGRKVAERTLARHRLLKRFLLKLGVEESIAEADCCEIEHALHDETVEAIERFLAEEND